VADIGLTKKRRQAVARPVASLENRRISDLKPVSIDWVCIKNYGKFRFDLRKAKINDQVPTRFADATAATLSGLRPGGQTIRRRTGNEFKIGGLRRYAVILDRPFL
jgi:hypothetical protein